MANQPDCAKVNISCAYFALMANMTAWMMDEEEANKGEKLKMSVKICVVCGRI